MSKINLYRNDKGEVEYKIKGKIFQLNYDSFDKLIDIVMNEEDSYEVEGDDDLVEYKKLILGIIKGVSTEDFKSAVNAAVQSENEFKKIEEEMIK